MRTIYYRVPMKMSVCVTTVTCSANASCPVYTFAFKAFIIKVTGYHAVILWITNTLLLKEQNYPESPDIIYCVPHS